MAKFNIFLMVALLFAIIATMVSPTFAKQKKKPAPRRAVATRKDYKTWQTCSQKLTPWCGHEIVDGIIESGKVDNDCCGQFIHIGRHCIKTMEKLILSENLFRPERPKIPKKTTEVWKKCVDHLNKKKKKSKHGKSAPKKQKSKHGKSALTKQKPKHEKSAPRKQKSKHGKSAPTEQ